MKKVKTMLALLLVFCMIAALFAACAKTEEPKQDPAPAANQPAATDDKPEETPAVKNPEPAEDDEPAPAEDEEIVNLTLYIYDLYMHGENGQKIIDAANAILETKAHAHLNIEWFDMASYATQLGLNIAGGVPLDLVSVSPFPATSVAQLHSKNQLTEIKGYLKDFAPQTYAMMEPYFGAMSYDGGLYGLPTMKNWSNNQYIMMRADVLNELGLYDQAAAMTSWSEYEEILSKVTEAKLADGMYALGKARSNSVVNSIMAMGVDKFFDYELFDNCGDSIGLVASDNNGNIYSLYESDNAVNGMKLLADWNAKGYIWPESAFSDVDGDDLISSQLTFSKMEGGELGVEVRQLANCGTEMLCVKTANGYITTSQLTSWGITVPITCEEPEAACRVIELLYTDPELINLLLMGIEGEDYVFTSTGEIDYPEGKDSNSVEYHEPDWLFGNQFLVYPWVGNGADYRELAAKENENSATSPYLGFTLDVSALDNVIAAMTAVKDQYAASLACGLYTDELYNEFIDKLYAQGFQDYMDAIQEQLTAFVSSR